VNGAFKKKKLLCIGQGRSCGGIPAKTFKNLADEPSSQHRGEKRRGVEVILPGGFIDSTQVSAVGAISNKNALRRARFNYQLPIVAVPKTGSTSFYVFKELFVIYL